MGKRSWRLLSEISYAFGTSGTPRDPRGTILEAKTLKIDDRCTLFEDHIIFMTVTHFLARRSSELEFWKLFQNKAYRTRVLDFFLQETVLRP